MNNGGNGYKYPPEVDCVENLLTNGYKYHTEVDCVKNLLTNGYINHTEVDCVKNLLTNGYINHTEVDCVKNLLTFRSTFFFKDCSFSSSSSCCFSMRFLETVDSRITRSYLSL